MEIIVRKPSIEEEEHMKNCPIWECDIKKFDYSYDVEERCLIIEGKVDIYFDGNVTSFGAGDYVVFPVGLKCVWDVKQKVRKHYEFV